MPNQRLLFVHKAQFHPVLLLQPELLQSSRIQSMRTPVQRQGGRKKKQCFRLVQKKEQEKPSILNTETRSESMNLQDKIYIKVLPH